MPNSRPLFCDSCQRHSGDISALQHFVTMPKFLTIELLSTSFGQTVLPASMETALQSSQLCQRAESGKQHPAPPARDINFDGERRQIKTLRVGWNPQPDTMNFTVTDLQMNGALTKRSVLLKISQIYNPFRLTLAVTIKTRVALQDIWKSKQFDWDDPLPEGIKDLWQNLFEDMLMELLHSCCGLHQMSLKFALFQPKQD